MCFINLITVADLVVIQRLTVGLLSGWNESVPPDRAGENRSG